jgi:HD-like signal output (HDOD) protein/ActR/RegA family two-component response regulator
VRRILFVDDEPRVLEGLRRLLRVYRHEWEMVFVQGGEAALSELEASPFDVVVSDMRMPGMDGLALLGRVQERFPDVLRIVLSGHTDQEAALRAVPIAHQFLSKPTDPEALKAVINRAWSLRALVHDEELQRVIGGIDSLPTLPHVYAALARALADPDASVQHIAEIVQGDAGICGKILQLINSAFFGLPRHVGSVQEGIYYLGVETIKNLVLAIEVFRAFDRGGGLAGFSPEAEQSHALLVARVARRLLPDKRQAEDAFMAAMLHDIGKLILASRLPAYFAEALTAAREKACSLHLAERELRGVTHAEIGAYLLDLWGLPYPIVAAVAHHHDPARAEEEGFGLVGAVYLADRLVHELTAGTRAADAAAPPEIDAAYVERAGVGDRLPAWREMAAEQAGAGAD